MIAKHDSVLMSEVLKALDVHPSDTVVDATLGGAGHFERILSSLGGDGVLVAIDADPAAVGRGREVYAQDRRPGRPVVHLINDNFRNLSRILERIGVYPVDAILFDLGWSGYQVASLRGFSFQSDEPLLMTYGESGVTAADIINSSSEETLADLLFVHGEERFARGIAKAIVEARTKERILTTDALVKAVLAGTPSWYHKGKTHPATKTFQALRIAVNDELGALQEGLTAALRALASGGRLAVISFHSIEDRVVKQVLKDAVQSGIGLLSPKKPIVPTRQEVLANRRARSAKLRVFHRAEKMSSSESTLSVARSLAYTIPTP